MLSILNSNIKHNINELNRIKKLNKKINKNVKKQEFFDINKNKINKDKPNDENFECRDYLNVNVTEIKEIKPIEKKHFNIIINNKNEIDNIIDDNSINFKINKVNLENSILTKMNEKLDLQKEELIMMTQIKESQSVELKHVEKKHFDMTIHNNNITNNNVVEFNIVTNNLSKNNQFNNKSLIDNIRYLSSFTINIVHQYKYKNKDITGFGDFIRGIYFVLQFSEKYNLNFEFNINNHIIKKYLDYFTNKPNISEDISLNISFLELSNSNYLNKNRIIDYDYINIDYEFSNFLINLPNYNNNKYLYTINHPDQKLISNIHKDFVKNIIKPTDYIYNLTERALANLNLVKHKFITIHIRTNDDCFSNKKTLDIINKNLMFLLDFIKKIYLHHRLDIFILSSDNNVKTNIIRHFTQVKILVHNISHTCLNNNDDESIINTLKDFYIMSYSRYIYSFSIYEHGSGFSKWCATTYNIPYICYSLKK